MSESKTITVRKGMPLAERISEVAKQISEWLDSFGEISNGESNSLRLVRAEETEEDFKFQYSVDIGKNLSASNAKIKAKPSLETEASKQDTTVLKTDHVSLTE